ncbi:unnamed protein product [Oppiella nova]|uniref:Uncharacterized protein n=1 Tax=Oppiella nova TaxID=334625 RepID=A0A7R9QTA5_9ACAR|nr:unnamed protein product [Oppiella nova]CAG2173204.1 unnamed protein product [Oppiella nova]
MPVLYHTSPPLATNIHFSFVDLLCIICLTHLLSVFPLPTGAVVRRNPITGEVYDEPKTNGHNGVNGRVNGMNRLKDFSKSYMDRHHYQLLPFVSVNHQLYRQELQKRKGMETTETPYSRVGIPLRKRMQDMWKMFRDLLKHCDKYPHNKHPLLSTPQHFYTHYKYITTTTPMDVSLTCERED